MSILDLKIGLSFFALAFGGAAAFAESYPVRDVTMVIPFSPGGSNDTVGRFVAEALSKKWGQAVVVENRPGAGSSIGAAYVTQQDPDGYTLMFVSNSLTTAAASNPNIPFDVKSDLQPIAIAAIGEQFVLTGTKTPILSLSELQARAREGRLFMGTAGMGSFGHLSGVLVAEKLGVEFEAVHYAGGNEASIDLAAGRLDLAVQSAADAVKGHGTVIAVAANERSLLFPDVATSVEQGFPDLLTYIWLGVFAPSGIDSQISEKINQDVREIMKTEQAQKFLVSQGSVGSDMTVEQATKFVADEADLWVGVAQRNGIGSK